MPGTHLDSELYMQISRSFRGNDQNMMRRWTGSGIRSYRSSMRWKGSDSATMRAVISNNESGWRMISDRFGLCEWRCVMNGHIWPDIVGCVLFGWNRPWQQDIFFFLLIRVCVCCSNVFLSSFFLFFLLCRSIRFCSINDQITKIRCCFEAQRAAFTTSIFCIYSFWCFFSLFNFECVCV